MLVTITMTQEVRKKVTQRQNSLKDVTFFVGQALGLSQLQSQPAFLTRVTLFLNFLFSLWQIHISTYFQIHFLPLFASINLSK